MIILFHLAPSRMLYGKYFLRYGFLKIYLWKLRIEFFSIFYDFEKGVYLCLFECANTTKPIYEHCCSSVRRILAHLAEFLFFLFKCDKWIDIFIKKSQDYVEIVGFYRPFYTRPILTPGIQICSQKRSQVNISIGYSYISQVKIL